MWPKISKESVTDGEKTKELDILARKSTIFREETKWVPL